MTRTFHVQPGRTVTLPRGLASGPGATNMRLDPGAVVTLDDDDKITEFSRYINNRLRAEDWLEIDPKDAPKDSPAHRYVKHHDDPGTGNVQIVTGGPSTAGKKG